MIFSHIQKPLGMRKTRMGKRIYVQGVPLDTIWFCPYCCATVDTVLSVLSNAKLSRFMLIWHLRKIRCSVWLGC